MKIDKCELCSDLIKLICEHDERVESRGLFLTKSEIRAFAAYIEAWSQRQCLCPFKDVNNFERVNNIVQIILSRVLEVVNDLKEQCLRKNNIRTDEGNENNSSLIDKRLEAAKKVDHDFSESGGSNSKIIEERDNDEQWNNHEKEELFLLGARAFLINFPLYIIYRHTIHSRVEDLSQLEINALSNYCKLADADLPLYLLRNVCYFCDNNGVQAIGNLFEVADAVSLPVNLAHTLVNLIANVRRWLLVNAEMNIVIPIRKNVNHYMCRLSDKELRMAGMQNLTDLLWSAFKEPIESQLIFDRDSMEVTYKYFTCSTLTIRLTGISQINNQITLYNELSAGEGLLDVDSGRQKLADWLIEKKFVEHIFGPNLHLEIVKQSQLIVSFLAIEDRLTDELVDCIWSAAQLKHCSKQVLDMLILLNRTLCDRPARHLLSLVAQLEPSAHTEQTLTLASALTKSAWSRPASLHKTITLSSNRGHLGGGDGNDLHLTTPSHAHLDVEFSSGSSSNNESLIMVRHVARAVLNKKALATKRSLSNVSNRAQQNNGGHGRGKPLAQGSNEDDMEVSCEECDEADHTESSSSDGYQEKQVSEGVVTPNKRRKMEMTQQERSKSARVKDSEIDDDGEMSDDDGDIGDDEEEEGGSEEEIEGDESEDGHEYSTNSTQQRVTRDSEQSQSDYDVSSDESANEQAKNVGIRKAVAANMAKSEMLRKKVMCRNCNHPHHVLPLEDDSELLGTPKEEIEINTSSEIERQEQLLMKEGMSSCEECVLVCDHDAELVADEFDHQLCASEQFSGCKRHSPVVYEKYLQDLGDKCDADKDSNIPTELINSIMTAEEEASCNSSHMSNKSEKNMDDFEGEELLTEEELAHIEPIGRLGQLPLQQHLANMAALYKDKPRGPAHHCTKRCKTEVVNSFSDVCKPGNTLVWDLLQDDAVNKLPEGLAAEAEKVLFQMVCFCTEKQIKLRFIEACIDNVACHKSVMVSLRLLPKILMTFISCRGGPPAIAVTQWAEEELHMLQHFFNDLNYLTSVRHTLRSTNYKEEVQVRLQFLTCIFSTVGSPENLCLRVDQVDILWNCLARDLECCDDFFTWLLNQARNKEQHALGKDSFQHIFLNKIPELPPEQMTLVGLNLFTQLCQMARTASNNNSLDIVLTEDQLSGMDQLWKIALRAHNTDVSLTAVHTLNDYYLNYGSGMLEKEEEFVECCMRHLENASKLLDQNPESSLMIIQRGLLLLTSHLESFRRKYAYHLRMWSLNGIGISCHGNQQKLKMEKHFNTIVIIVNSNSATTERPTLEMSLSDLVGDLRAEVTAWWQNRAAQQEIVEVNRGPEGPLRIITQGQELGPDLDEHSLAEQQFKDSQLVYVSMGANRPMKKVDGNSPACYLPPPPREKLPMMLLLEQRHFEMFFSLLQQLSCFKQSADGGEETQNLTTKAYLLSRKVWDLLMMLPTNPCLLDSFTQMESNSWDQLLSPVNPHKLLYGLQIVDLLCQAHKPRTHSEIFGRSTDSLSCEEGANTSETWSAKFMASGGMHHLIANILFSDVLVSTEGSMNVQTEWQQDCLGNLLRLLCHIGVKRGEYDDDIDSSVGIVRESPRKRVQRSHIRLIVPTLSENLLSLINTSQVIPLLLQVIRKAALTQCDNVDWPLMSSSYIEVVHYAMSFLTLWTFSSDDVFEIFVQNDMFVPWLKRITIEASETQIRQETCQSLYKLCLGKTIDGRTGYRYLLPILAGLVSFLQEAQALKSLPRKSDDEKDPFGPSCKDYFWIVCRLVDAISKADAIKTWTEGGVIDLNQLMGQVADCICERECYEKYHSSDVDDALVGLLTLATELLQHNPPFKTLPEGKVFLNQIFDCIFALPTPNNRMLPKCKTKESRRAAFDVLVGLVKGSVENYSLLHSKIIRQHQKDVHAPYSWDKWPLEDERSACGYVGLTNLGATCYMATCMQHLYMIPEARKSVLEAQCTKESKHCSTLIELKRMFAFLMESERKAFNPKNFCRVYTMDHRPLNTGEQKDMTEFFIDLITKLEEMGPDLKRFVKSMFGGVITNNVVSLVSSVVDIVPLAYGFAHYVDNLDCPHVSQTKEEFYTVRCQVADIKNLYESLDEVTVKDMLEGDNMYTCSRCQKKVRAEKRACFRKLPKMLCFNTMRYTFNMVTMMKEKVNTHFSFPLHLDMSPYMEQNLIGQDKLFDTEIKEDYDEFGSSEEIRQSYEYELTGVTVHTGTAEGGHYYSFILDKMNKNEQGQAKWFFFNDAEVKPWDPAQIAAECFGGEMTSKTYDSVTDKFLDFSFEKTNSAYMLFYERVTPPKQSCSTSTDCKELMQSSTDIDSDASKFNIQLTPDLAEMIWTDNTQFLQDKNIFEHDYFSFLYQLCGYVTTTLTKDSANERVSLLAAQLSASFVLETLIHAKEKPTMVQWIELLTKQFNSCPQACEWFLQTLAEDDWWSQQILIKCPNQTVRQMFQRLIVHVINQLRPTHCHIYGQISDSDQLIGANESCVTRFVLKLLSIIDNGARPHCKFLSEYFTFLCEFAKMGDPEVNFLLHTNTISLVIHFFLSHKIRENYVEILSDSDGDDEEDINPSLSNDKYRPQSFEKMVSLVALLVESSRGVDGQLHLPERDLFAIIDNNCAFLYNQIYDCINLQDTARLIVSLCQRDESLTIQIVGMILESITKLCMEAQAFLKLLLLLMDYAESDPELNHFAQTVLGNFWNICECCPQLCLDWLSGQVVRNKLVHEWALSCLNMWVEPYLFHSNSRIRNGAMFVLVSLIPNARFRQVFQQSRNLISPHKELITQMNQEAVEVVHQIYGHLLRLLSPARQYIEVNTPNTNRLVNYFTLMTFCLLSKQEKRMFTPFTMDLWNLFRPHLSEPTVSRNHNKQALMVFWNNVCVDCPENVKAIVQHQVMMKNIPFIYILADHEDQSVISFNRLLLPAYYGLLRMCCQQSSEFTRYLANHDNLHWALRYIAPYPTQYLAAVEELFRMVRLMAEDHADDSEEERKAIAHFRQTVIQMALSHLDTRSHWQALVTLLKFVVLSNEECLMVIRNRGLEILSDTFSTLYLMHHEATACHVGAELIDLLSLMKQVLKAGVPALTERGRNSEVREQLMRWKHQPELCQKLLNLLNSYQPADIRQAAIDMLSEIVMAYQAEAVHIVTQLLLQQHMAFHDSTAIPVSGPYFPHSSRGMVNKSALRMVRPQFNMMLHSVMIKDSLAEDDTYEAAVREYFMPYHRLVDLIVRVATNHKNLTPNVIRLSLLVGLEGAMIGLPLFAKLWYDIYQSDLTDKSCISHLCDHPTFADYVSTVLLNHRASLNDQHIYQFMCTYLPKIQHHLLLKKKDQMFHSIYTTLGTYQQLLEKINSEDMHNIIRLMQRIQAEQRAVMLVVSVDINKYRPPEQLINKLKEIQTIVLRLRHVMSAAKQSSSEAVADENVPTKRQCLESDHENKSVETLSSQQDEASGSSSTKKECSSKDHAKDKDSGLQQPNDVNSPCNLLSKDKLDSTAGSNCVQTASLLLASNAKELPSNKTEPEIKPGNNSNNGSIGIDGLVTSGTCNAQQSAATAAKVNVHEQVEVSTNREQTSNISTPVPANNRTGVHQAQDVQPGFSSAEAGNVSVTSLSTAGESSKNISGSDIGSKRGIGRSDKEKPSIIDLVLKHMDTIFSFVQRVKDS